MMLDACFVEECTEEEDFLGAAWSHFVRLPQETDFIPPSRDSGCRTSASQ